MVEILEKSLDRDISKTKWILTPFGKWVMEKMGLEFENFAHVIDDKAQMRKLRQEFEDCQKLE